MRTPVALHVALGGGGGRGGGYPASLLGTISFVRQSFLDAQHQQLERQRYDKAKTGVARPMFDPSLDAIQPALARTLPVAFEAELAREILRALTMAKEFNLDPVITGAREADQVVADLKARNARVIFGLELSRRDRAPCRPTPTSRSASCARAPTPPKTPARSRRQACRSRSRRDRFSSRATSCATPPARSRRVCRPTPRCAR